MLTGGVAGSVFASPPTCWFYYQYYHHYVFMYFFIFFSFQLPYWPGSEQWERTTQVCKNFQSQKFRRQIKYKEEANVTQLDVWCWFSTTPGTDLTLVWQPSKPEGRGGRYEQQGKSLGLNFCGVECLLIRDLASVRKNFHWECFIFQWVHGTAEHEGI